jgi:hypothetical protein
LNWPIRESKLSELASPRIPQVPIFAGLLHVASGGRKNRGPDLTNAAENDHPHQALDGTIQTGRTKGRA